LKEILYFLIREPSTTFSLIKVDSETLREMIPVSASFGTLVSFT